MNTARRTISVATAALVAASLAACPRTTSVNGGEQPTGRDGSDGGSATTRHDSDANIEPGATDASVEPDSETKRAGGGERGGDDDGDDDDDDPGVGAVPARARFEKIGTPPLALTRICDLTPLGDSLYAAHAHQPLGTDGATITRYTPGDAKPFRVAFDWNRRGEPAKGGGAGQGFVRVHKIGGRLFVPDADPPYNGLGLAEWGTEGYVFVSDAEGSFAPSRAPNHRPPLAPDLLAWREGKAGAAVLPRAYHVLDVIRFRGALYASTGSVPPNAQAWRGPSPGALHRASDDGARWTYEVDYPYPYLDGVWRLTYMVRFRGRLYAGIQDYDGRDPHDYVYFAPSSSARATTQAEARANEARESEDAGASDAGASEGAGASAGAGSRTKGKAVKAPPPPPPPPLLSRQDLHAVRVTASGAGGTLRWWVDKKASPRRLYWIVWGRDGVNLRVTTDGDTWRVVPMAPGAGRPTDITRFRDRVVVLAERGVYALTSAGDEVDETPIASVDAKEKRSPFDLTDFFCAAPLAVFGDALYAGGQRGGALYKLIDE